MKTRLVTSLYMICRYTAGFHLHIQTVTSLNEDDTESSTVDTDDTGDGVQLLCPISRSSQSRESGDVA